jgi:3-hydroxybutyryl-CoA dehydrogenase
MNRAIHRIGIVGTGLMGRGIAQISAQGGYETLLFDARDGAAGEAKAAIVETLGKLAAKGKLDEAQVKEAAERLVVTQKLDELASCDLVIEAIVENLAAKQELFARLEEIVDGHCLLATNTSSLSVTAIAAVCKHPGRVGGFHFFSPVPLMRLVEVIDGALTSNWVTEALVAVAVQMGHTPVRAKDTPGFIVNHAGRGYGTEALRILGENVAEFHVVDRILKESVGFRMGPFELLDLTGLDVSQPVMESIYNQYYQEPRFRPSPLLAQRRDARLLGRKTGRGFYEYREGAQQPALFPPVPDARPVRAWVSPADAAGREKVASLLAALGAQIDGGDAPAEDSLLLVTPLGLDATTAAVRQKLDPARVMAVDTLFDLGRHRTLMTTPATSHGMRDAAHALFAKDGTPVSVIRDSAGFVAQRVVAHIVNIACDIAQQAIAVPGDIDRAVKLGLSYPDGPLAMGDKLGPATVLGILEGLQETSGDPRYRPSPWLRRRAQLGMSLLTAGA